MRAFAIPTRPRLWQLMNGPRRFHPSAVRICCIVLAVVFGGMAALRSLETGQIGFLVPRAAMLTYALVGVFWAPRFGWSALRAYTVGLSLILPLTASYVIGMAGYAPADVPFCLLATFTPFMFVLSGWDFVIANTLLVAGHAAVFAVIPEPMTPRGTLWAAQLATMACGTAAGVLMVTFRGLVAESRQWWEESHAREHTLREFAEVAAATLTSDQALSTLAATFTTATPARACVVVLADPDGALRVAAASGTPRAVSGARLPFDLTVPSADPTPSLRAADCVSPRHAPVMAAWLGASERLDDVIVLPLPGLVRGFLVLVADERERITSDTVLMWSAMAQTLAVTVANAQAVAILRDREADARRLSEERIAVADMRTRFVTQASHEFRTPLAVILSAAGSLERYVDRLTPDQRDQKLRRIREAVSHMTMLLDDVLTLGRTENRARRRVATDLKQLCETVVSQIGETTQSLHRLAFHCREPEVVLAVDPALVERIVGNLLTNAVKYSPAGGPVVLELERRPSAAVLRVRDQGIGIPEENRAHLFESFRRATNVGSIPGSGLGLTIVQRAVEAHQGSIHIESEIGVGTTVELVLPDASSDQEASASPPSADGSPA